jgi:hypothetical protein
MAQVISKMADLLSPLALKFHTVSLISIFSVKRCSDPTNPLDYKPAAFIGAREKLMMERLKAATRQPTLDITYIPLSLVPAITAHAFI